MPTPLLLVLVVSLPFLFVLARKPVLRRLALRNATRRPRESLLVIAGSLLGTAIMTGSFVVGDTFNASIRAGAYDQLGPIDVVVATLGPERGAAINDALADFDDPNVDGVLALTTADVATATTSEPRRGEANSQLLEVDFASARDFGDDPAATGISGETPGVGEVVVGEDLARSLAVGVGDEIDIFARSESLRLRVTDVLPQRGIAGFWIGFESTSNNLLVAPGTLAAELPAASETARSMVVVSNSGGVEGGAEPSDEVVAAIQPHIEGLDASIIDAKQRLLDAATEAGDQLTQLYTSLGFFAVIAGILLLVNIFFMLADERKSELGMLRAVGLRRSSLVGAFATEGWCYAIVSAIAGTFVGLGLGRLIMAGASRIFSSGDEDFRLKLRWDFEWSSVFAGLAVGFTIAIITVGITSLWLARFNIIQAVRDITEPPRRRPRKRALYGGLVLAVFGLLLTSVGVSTAAFFPLIVGPVFVFVGLGPALARNFPRSAVTTALAAIVLVWGVLAVPITIVLDTEPEVFLFVVQGLVLVGAAVVLVTEHQSAIGHALGRVANRSLRVRLGLAYPLARKLRTALTLGMFALVMFVLVFVSVISAMFSTQSDEFTADVSGGFNTLVTSNEGNPVDFDALAQEPGVTAVAPVITLEADIILEGETEPQVGRLSGIDASFLTGGEVSLADAPDFAADEDAFRTLVDDPSLVFVDEFFLQNGAGPPQAALAIGETFIARDPASGREMTFTVAAESETDLVFSGAFISAQAAQELFGERAVPNRAYVTVDDPETFSAEFSPRFLENGGEADPIRALVEDQISQQNQFFMLMRGYLALGLIVGVAGIGVIMVRAVRERRRQVGVLRALGFDAKAVGWAFVIESAFVAVEGTLIGTVLALITAYSITMTDTFGDSFDFVVPWLTIFVLIVGTLLFALLATAAPARSAARIKPAVALRIAD